MILVGATVANATGSIVLQPCSVFFLCGCFMKLSCPVCHTRFTLTDEALGPNGRKVRCSVCSHVWQAEPALLLQPDAGQGSADPPDIAQAYADSPVLETGTPNDTLEDLPPLPAESIPTWDSPAAAAIPAAAAAAVVAPRRRGWGGVIIGLALLAAIAASYGLRDDIVKTLPAAKPVFQLAELPLAQAGLGLEFINLASGPVTENGQPMLQVTGFINNANSVRRQVPFVQIEVRDRADRVVAHATRPPPQPGLIEAQKALAFIYDLPRPDQPTEGLTVALRFVEGPQK